MKIVNITTIICQLFQNTIVAENLEFSNWVLKIHKNVALKMFYKCHISKSSLELVFGSEIANFINFQLFLIWGFNSNPIRDFQEDSDKTPFQ